MTDEPTLDALFEPEPRQWGLRGDPHVWRALRERLAGLPATGDVAGLLHAAFTDIVGVDLADRELPEQVRREEFDHGGMSGGWISIETWRTRLMPLLESRVTPR